MEIPRQNKLENMILETVSDGNWKSLASITTEIGEKVGVENKTQYKVLLEKVSFSAGLLVGSHILISSKRGNGNSPLPTVRLNQ